MTRIQIDVDRRDGTVTVGVTGEIDLYTAPRLSECIANTYDPDATVRLDLSEVTFADCALLRLLHTAQDSRGSSGSAVQVIQASGPVLRLLNLVGEEHKFVQRPKTHATL